MLKMSVRKSTFLIIAWFSFHITNSEGSHGGQLFRWLREMWLQIAFSRPTLNDRKYPQAYLKLNYF